MHTYTLSKFNDRNDLIQDCLIFVLTQESIRYQVHFERLSLNECSQVVE
jgi:hypothetical protein